MVGVSPVPQDMQMLVNNAPASRELLQRPEAQAIIQGLQQGEITRQHLIQQLQVRGLHSVCSFLAMCFKIFYHRLVYFSFRIRQCSIVIEKFS